MKFFQRIAAAARNLLVHPLRSFLTVLGIVAGVAAVVLVSSIAEGTKEDVRHTIEGLGANRVDVHSGTLDAVRNATLPFGGLYQLNEGDVTALRMGLSEADGVTGLLRGSAAASFGRAQTTLSWVGGNGQVLTVLGYELASGRKISSEEGASSKRIAIIGDNTATKLFGGASPIGSRISLGDTRFLVIGVMKPRGISVSGQSMDDVILLPIDAGRRHLMAGFPLPYKAVQQVAISLRTADARLGLEQKIVQILRAHRGTRPGESNDFFVSSVAETVKARRKADDSMSFLLLAVAGICLFVGGVGVMNIMLVSMSERIGEIGLRMAVGASPSHIRELFMTEAMLLCIIGGTTGLGIGVIAAHLIAAHRQTATYVNHSVLITAFLVTLLTGIVFGFWPAHMASTMRPVEALRRM